MASTITPTSAKIAIHMLAMPTAPRTRQSSLTPRANQMFSLTIAMHFLAMRTAFATLLGSSSISTTSAASMAASDPMAPMAMPTSARARTGASLMPSPTNASLAPAGFFSRISSTLATLSAGSSSAQTRSTPTDFAISSAAALRSPVSITVSLMPAALSAEIASFDCGFTTSAMRMWPT